MLIDKTIEIIVWQSSINHLKSLGYLNLHIKEKIKIPIEHLQKNSTVVVRAKCDVCGKERNIRYLEYNKSFNLGKCFCCSRNCNSIKIKNTNLQKYGVEVPIQNKEIKEKTQKTNLKKYGTKNAASNKDVKKKIEDTNIIKYGVKRPAQNENINNKRKITNLSKYGAENPLINKEIKAKSDATCLKKFGSISPMQAEDIFNKVQVNGLRIKIHEKTGLCYQGTYEKDFLDFCFKNNIKVEKGKLIKYFFNEKFRTYHSDFYIKNKNLVIEIKSTYIFNKEKEKNTAKKDTCMENGFDFLFIIDKKYDKFLELVSD